MTTAMMTNRAVPTAARRAHATVQQTHEHDGLTFADPALEAFAEAVRLPPLLLARWLIIAAWDAVRRNLARKLDIE